MIDSLFRTNLGYRKGEHIGFVYDNEHSRIARLVTDYCISKNLPINSNFLEYTSGTVLPANIKSLFLEDIPEVIIIALRENIWHTPERKIAKYERGKRLLNLLNSDDPPKSYLADIDRMKFIGRQLEEIMKESDKIYVFSEAGTAIEARIAKIFCETGDYTLPRSGGDFPAGEVGFGPIEESVNGIIVYDFKIQHVGFVKETPHLIRVKKDFVEILMASEAYKNLVKSNSILSYISEISLGINPIWIEVINKDSIIEEKNLGTIHFGQGSNLSYGHRAGPHFDCVILKPTVYFDSSLIMDRGVLNETYINLKA